MSDIKLTSNIRLIAIPGEIAGGMARRLCALQGMVECIRHKLAHGSESAASNALDGVLWEIERIAIDLDIHAWEQRDGQSQFMEPANQ